jgi:2,4-dienoyl-CoA reductase-like NADH-dependent reductase (Old Yellow Enzyme family)
VASALEALFTPGTIGTLSVRNRIHMPPMGTHYATWTGAVTDRLIAYHAERARGGVGLITVEYSYVHPTGRISYYALGVHDDALIPGLRRLTSAIHAEGAKVSIQIAHAGRRGKSAITGTQPMAPSPMPCIGGEVPRELSPAEIQNVIAWFVQAARRVREAGFDAVTLHLAAGYLLERRVTAVRGTTVTYEQGGLMHRLEGVETVVAAVGSSAHRPLGEALQVPGATVHFIGDCVKPRRILEAMREGFELAYAL